MIAAPITTATRGVGARRRSVGLAAPAASVTVPGLDAGAGLGRRPPSSVRLADVDERPGGPLPSLASAGGSSSPDAAAAVRRRRRGGRAVDRPPSPRPGSRSHRAGQVAPTAADLRRPGAGRRARASASSLDLVLTERLTRAELRERLERACPAGRRIVDLFDVWLGEPSLAARLGRRRLPDRRGRREAGRARRGGPRAGGGRRRCRAAARRGRAGRSTTTSDRWSSTWRTSRAGRRRPTRPRFGCGSGSPRTARRAGSRSSWPRSPSRPDASSRCVSAVRERLLTSDELDGRLPRRPVPARRRFDARRAAPYHSPSRPTQSGASPCP